MAPRPDTILLPGEAADQQVPAVKENTDAGVGAANQILLKISPSKRGNLWALVARDHYVEVITDRGCELVLMRFGDALQLCADGSGIRCHRSAWVSNSGFGNVLRKANRRLVVRLPDGQEIPVSRSREKQVLNHQDNAIAA